MQKQIIVDGLLRNYDIEQIDETKQWIVMLHGRGQSRQTFQELKKYLTASYNILIPDFPWFGKSHVPSTARWVPEYAQWLNKLLDKLNIKKCSIISHSFWGRVVIDLYQMHTIDISKLMLIASGWYRPPITTKAKIFLLLKNIADKIWLSKVIYDTPLEKYVQLVFASRDYLYAHGMMKEIVKLAVNYDQSKVLHKIQIPTLLIRWTKDDETPIADAHYFHQEIKNSQLQIKEWATHFVFHEHPERTGNLITSFLNDTTK